MLRKTRLLLLLLTVSALASGCAAGSRTVLVPPVTWIDGTPTDFIKIGPDITGQVYTYDGKEWVLSTNKVTIPEGWVALPEPPKEK